MIVGSLSGRSVTYYLMALSDTSLHSADSLSNEAFSPALTAPALSSPSAFPLICSLDMKNKFWRIMLALLAYM